MVEPLENLKMRLFQARMDDLKRRNDAVSKWAEDIDSMGMTRNEFCRRTGMSASQLSRLLNGINVPTWPLIKRISGRIAAMKRVV